MTQKSSSSTSLPDSDLNSISKQFFLETERLEFTFQKLQEKFNSVQKEIGQSQIKTSAQLAELDFISHYLDAILNHMSQGILFLDLNGIVTTCNLAACRLLNLQAESVLFHPISKFLEDAFFGFSLKEILTTKMAPSPGTFKQTVNGQIVELEIEAVFVAMDEKKLPLSRSFESSFSQATGLLILLRDCTKIRRLQESLHHHQRLQELGELAAHLAHEIRNPLGGIRGFASLLQQELQQRPDLQQMASYIIEGADGLSHLVSQILNYSRPFQTHLEKMEVIGMIHELTRLLQADEAWRASIQLIVEAKSPEIWVHLDSQLIKSAILNLLINAVQAMPKGGVLRITIDVDCDFLTIGISDTGVGIAEENLPKLFSPFFTTKEKGTGLGLAEVQKAIQAHFGSIEVESIAGKGTSFTIKIKV